MTDSPHRPTLFIDRNSGGRLFQGLIENAGIKVVLHDEYFSDPQTPDEVWVEETGRLGWLMVTGDGATRRLPLFLEALARSTACVFFIDALNGASREGKAQYIIDAYEKIVKIASEREHPLYWQFDKGGEVYTVPWRERLAGYKRKP